MRKRWTIKIQPRVRSQAGYQITMLRGDGDRATADDTLILRPVGKKGEAIRGEIGEMPEKRVLGH